MEACSYPFPAGETVSGSLDSSLWCRRLLIKWFCAQTHTDVVLAAYEHQDRLIQKCRTTATNYLEVKFAWVLTRWEVSLQVHHWRGRRLMLCAVGRWFTCHGALLQPGISLATICLCVPLWTRIDWQPVYIDHGLWLCVSDIRTNLVCFSCSKKHNELNFGYKCWFLVKPIKAVAMSKHWHQRWEEGKHARKHASHNKLNYMRQYE